MSPNGLSGLGARIGATILIAIGWLVFLIIHLAFWAGSFNIWQNIAVFLASLLIAGGLVVAIWIIWGTERFVET